MICHDPPGDAVPKMDDGELRSDVLLLCEVVQYAQRMVIGSTPDWWHSVLMSFSSRPFVTCFKSRRGLPDSLKPWMPHVILMPVCSVVGDCR